MRRINHSSRFIEMFGNLESKKRLGDVASYINGFAFKPSDWSSTGLPIIRIQNLTGTNEVYNYYNGDYPDQVEVNNGDILISWSATLGVYVWTEGKALLNQHIFKVSFDKGYINRDYFIYAVTQKLDEMSTKTHGTTMRHIVKSDFDNTIIPFPSIEGQDRFALVAKQADKSKFTGFKSRFIEMFGSLENTKPLSECIGTTFPGEWGEDDLDGSGVNVIRTTNFTNSGKLDLTNVLTRKIDQAKIDKKHLVSGDIILERSGGTADNPVGRVVYFEADGTFLFNNFTQLLRCKDGVNSLFVFYSLFNYYHTHKNEIRSMGNKTTGIQNLKMDKYWDISIADASPEQQEQFVNLYKQAGKSKYLN